MGSVSLQADKLQKLVPGAPDSWVLGQRSIREVPAVEMVWTLDVSTLANTAQLSASQQKRIYLDSPHQMPPLGGVAFGIQVQMTWQRDAQGSKLGVYAKAKNAPDGTYLQLEFTLGAAGNTFDKQLSSLTSVFGAGI